MSFNSNLTLSFMRFLSSCESENQTKHTTLRSHRLVALFPSTADLSLQSQVTSQKNVPVLFRAFLETLLAKQHRIILA